MDNVFQFRDQLIERYGSFSRSFVRIAAADIQAEVEHQYAQGRYWPEPLVQINPNYQRQGTVQQLAEQGILHADCAEIFQIGKTEGSPQPLHLYKHQMEALAKGQLEELDKFLHGYAPELRPFTVKRYTGQESKAERSAIADDPPDILLTNFMMLEYILTRFDEVDRRVVEHCEGLEFLVLDELHTYRGRQGADVALLVRRLRERLKAAQLVCIGTSVTMSSTGTCCCRIRSDGT